jgi:hypothetical protein
VAVKNYFFILFLLASNILSADTFKSPNVQYWQGLVYDFANATGYEITQPVNDSIEVGVVALTSQLYWDCDGCYFIIPQNYAVKLNKRFDYKNIEINLSTNYWNTRSIIFPNKYNFELGLNYQLKEYSVIQFKHYTNSNNIHNLYNISFEHRF